MVKGGIVSYVIIRCGMNSMRGKGSKRGVEGVGQLRRVNMRFYTVKCITNTDVTSVIRY